MRRDAGLAGVRAHGRRTRFRGCFAYAHLALNASPITPYWRYYLGAWGQNGGTSFAAPVFAGMVAVMNDARAGAGKPRLGFLNPALYRTPAARAALRDVTIGKTKSFAAETGWDFPTGWGAPRAKALADALP